MRVPLLRDPKRTCIGVSECVNLISGAFSLYMYFFVRLSFSTVWTVALKEKSCYFSFSLLFILLVGLIVAFGNVTLA